MGPLICVFVGSPFLGSSDTVFPEQILASAYVVF